MNRPVVKLTVDDPRALGSINKPGWAGSFLPDFAGNLPQGWRFCGTEYIPSLKAIGPAGFVQRRDMWLGSGDAPDNYYGWAADEITWDDQAQPAGSPRTRFLHFYDGTPDATGRVVSTDLFSPNWCAWIYRYVPSSENSLPSAFSIRMNGLGLGYPSWRISVPTQTQSENAEKRPYLSYDAFGNYHEKVVSRWDDAPANGGLNSSWAEYVIWCEQTANQWIITIAVNGEWSGAAWVYTPPGCDVANPYVLDAAGNPTPVCGSGTIEIETIGQQLMASFAPMYYPVYSEVYLQRYWQLNTDLGDVANVTVDAVVVKPAGTDAACDVETNASDNSFGPRVSFGYAAGYQDGDNTKRAIMGLVNATLPATLNAAAPDASPWTSEGKHAQGTIRYTRRATWRGNTVSATFRDPEAAAAWLGNEVVTLEAAYQTAAGVTPTLRKLFTGYLAAPTRTKDGGKDLLLRLEASDFCGSRMGRRSAIFYPAFDSVDFYDAVHLVGNRLGFSAAQVSCSDAQGDITLPYNQLLGEPVMQFGAEANPEEVLDALCRYAGRVWGIDATGKLFTRAPYAYTGTPDFTLDSDTATEAEIIGYFENTRDMQEFANSVFAVTGPEGYRSFGWAQDTDSQTDDTADDFAGDTLTYVEVAERAWADAETLADAVLAKRAQIGQQLIWRPLKAQALDPGMFVKAQLEDSQVPADSVWLLVEENGEFDAQPGNQFGWAQTWTAVRVQ